MNKFYFLLLPAAVFLAAGCSKDFLKRYDDRIEGGTWTLYDVKSAGVGSGYGLPLTTGYFTFFSSGDLDYVDGQGNTYEGSWDIRKEYFDDQTRRQLQITVVDFNNQRVLTETFDDMQFTGTDKFRAFVYNGGRTYTFKFKR